MKPLSERDENRVKSLTSKSQRNSCRNEATLWKRWELCIIWEVQPKPHQSRNEATLWKRWEPRLILLWFTNVTGVGMKPLSERDENKLRILVTGFCYASCRNEATLWKRWELKKLSHYHQNILDSRNEATLWKRWELHQSCKYIIAKSVK